jgi:hypothetical protein
MIKIFPPLKDGKSSAESKKASGSKASDDDSKFTVSGSKNGRAASAPPSSEPAAADPNAFSVKAPQKKAPQPPSSKPKETKPKETEPSASVAPPKKKGSPKVQLAAAVPAEDDSKGGAPHKSHVVPPKKKSGGQAKVNVAAVLPELSAEDAYDYEL